MNKDVLFAIGVCGVLFLLVLAIRIINKRYFRKPNSTSIIFLSYLGVLSLAVIIYTLYTFAVLFLI
jgi:hypothetical protein